MISLNCYIDYQTDYGTDTLEVPSWTCLNTQPDPKKIEKEEKERIMAIQEQIKKGILKMPPPIKTVQIKSGDIGKVICNPAIVTMIKGVDLYQSCVCGSGQLLKDCHLKEVLSRK